MESNSEMESNFDQILTQAIENGDITFLRTHRSDYDIDHTLAGSNNDSLLNYSISYNSHDLFRFFIDEGASLATINDEGENIVHSIVYSGCEDRLRHILQIQSVNINHRSNDGTTPLLLSVLLNQPKIFELLIALGADVNIGDNEDNLPMHMACYFGHLEMVDILITLGSHLDKKTKKGNLPLALAANENHHDIVRKLFTILY